MAECERGGFAVPNRVNVHSPARLQRKAREPLTMLTIALLSLGSVATGAIPDGCYAPSLPAPSRVLLALPAPSRTAALPSLTEVHRGRPLYTSPLMAAANTVTWCHLVVTPTQGAR